MDNSLARSKAVKVRSRVHAADHRPALSECRKPIAGDKAIRSSRDLAHARRRNATGAPERSSIELKTLATLLANGSSEGSFSRTVPSYRALFGKSELPFT